MPSIRAIGWTIEYASPEESLTLADLELARAREYGEEVAEALMLMARGAALADLGDVAGLEDERRASDILDRHAHPRAGLAAYNAGNDLLVSGRVGEAEGYFRTAIEWGHRAAQPRVESAGWYGISRWSMYRGLIQEALEAAAKAQSLAVDDEGKLET